MDTVHLSTLFMLLFMIFLFISLIHSIGRSEESKIRKFRRMLKRKYKEKSLKFVLTTKLAGSYYYIFRTPKKAYTVSEDGEVSISKLQ